jgi:hypothetical protein
MNLSETFLDFFVGSVQSFNKAPKFLTQYLKTQIFQKKVDIQTVFQNAGARGHPNFKEIFGNFWMISFTVILAKSSRYLVEFGRHQAKI